MAIEKQVARAVKIKPSCDVKDCSVVAEYVVLDGEGRMAGTFCPSHAQVTVIRLQQEENER